MKIEDSQVLTRYWLDNYTRRGMCSLCGQSGILDTRATAITQGGMRCGEVHFCICPNGRKMREIGDAPRTFQEWAWRKSQEES